VQQLAAAAKTAIVENPEYINFRASKGK